ncbi:lysophospholipid acyltransferase family protein [Bacteroidota bacterium]
MKKIGVYLFIALSWLLSKAPQFILFGLADIIYVVLYYIIGYRKLVVYNNLRNSFPEKSEKEIKSIQKKFFHNLSDIFVENIALIKMSKKRVLQMVKFEETDLPEKLFKNKKSIIGITGHYGNWEVYLTLPEILPHIVLGVYKPLNNKFFDKQFYKMREKFDAIPVTMNDSYKTILNYKKKNELTFLGLVADQSPPKTGGNYWTTFLNQETAIFLGPEKIAKKLNAAVVFSYSEKIKRGKYLIKSKLLFENTSNCKEHEITESHVRFLESLINDNPECWLWSHKRWKHKRDPETPIH